MCSPYVVERDTGICTHGPGDIAEEAAVMKPFAVTISVGIAFFAGMLVPLLALHATEDFDRLEPMGALFLGGERKARTDGLDGQSAERALAVRTTYADAEWRAPAGAARRQPGPGLVPATAPAAIPANARVSSVMPASGDAVAEAPDKTAAYGERTAFSARNEEAAEIAAEPPTGAREPAPVPNVDIADIQILLRIRGFDPGPIDGVLGPKTANAIRAFEASENLPVTGAATAALQALLAGADSRASSDKEPTQTASVTSAVSTSAIAAAPQTGGKEGAPLSLVP